MGKIGFGEVLLILIIALVVVGPDKLPALGRQAGKAVRSLKKFISDAAKEMDIDEDIKSVRKDIADIQKDVRDIGKDIESSVDSVTSVTEKALRDTEKAADLSSVTVSDTPQTTQKKTDGEESTPQEKGE